MNLPNALTLSRIFLVPLLVVVLLTKFEGRLVLGLPKDLVGAAIFGLASLTDWLDGYVARRRKQVTTLGQMIDPIADKLLTSAAFISLVQMELASAWIVAVIIGREFAVTALRSLAYARGVAIPASPLGKTKMVAQVIAILALILGSEHLVDGRGVPFAHEFFVFGQIALWVVLTAAVVSAIDYYRRFNSVLTGVRVAERPDAEAAPDRKQVGL
jgi:CDP-diacylglycerol--glycerol-3-phosphate 3-phosphatidyltransferase